VAGIETLLIAQQCTYHEYIPFFGSSQIRLTIAPLPASRFWRDMDSNAHFEYRHLDAECRIWLVDGYA
jgi:hypothetical protein